MDGFIVGEIVVLEDQREFICYQKIQDGGKTYLFMLSNFKPLEVFFAEEIVQDGVCRMKTIDDPETKKRLVPLFGFELPELETEPEAAPQPTKTLNGDICDSRISVGETLTLENKGDYICYRTIRQGANEYLCLMSVSKPRDFMFAEEDAVDGVLSVKVVTNAEKKRELMEYIRTHRLETLKQIFTRKSKKK